MINPVNNSADLNRTTQTERNNSAKEKSKVSTGSTKSSDEEIHLSDAFREIEKLRSVIDNTSEIDDTRIQHIKNLIDSGQYQVDSKVIANKMINE